MRKSFNQRIEPSNRFLALWRTVQKPFLLLVLLHRIQERRAIALVLLSTRINSGFENVREWLLSQLRVELLHDRREVVRAHLRYDVALEVVCQRSHERANVLLRILSRALHELQRGLFLRRRELLVARDLARKLREHLHKLDDGAVTCARDDALFVAREVHPLEVLARALDLLEGFRALQRDGLLLQRARGFAERALEHGVERAEQSLGLGFALLGGLRGSPWHALVCGRARGLAFEDAHANGLACDSAADIFSLSHE